MSNVLILNETHALQKLLDRHNKGAQEILRRALLARDQPRCLCREDKQLRLVIKRYPESDELYLAKLPHTGFQHATNCPYQLETPPGSRISQPAVQGREDGTLDFNLGFSLSRRKPSSSSDRQKSRGKRHDSGQSCGRVGLGGLLERLWAEARLNQWPPAERFFSINTAPKRLKTTLERCTYNDGRRLENFLVIPMWQGQTGMSQGENRQLILDANRSEAVRKTPDGNRGIVLIGRLVRWIRSSKEEGSAGLRVDLFPDALWMGAELAEKIDSSLGFGAQASAEIAKDDRYIVAACLVFRKGNSWSAEDVALLRVSPEFIPADSGYELEVIRRLVAEQRHFIKPLRMRADEEVLPDFHLLDTDPACCLEVYGIDNNEKYLKRKAEKMRWYQQRQIPCWTWEPTAEKTMPPFPPSGMNRKDKAG